MFNLRIVSPKGIYSEIEVDSLTLPTIDGQRTILANHMPIVLPLQIGIMYYKLNGEMHKFFLSEGLFTFEDNHGTILVNTVENQEEIDFNRAEERLKNQQGSVDMKRAELALQRSLTRLKLRQ